MSQQDRDFEDYLNGDSELSRSYRGASREEPDARLDAAILRAAARQPKAKPRPAYSPFSRNWMIPASLAAVLVLSVTLTFFATDPVSEYHGSPDTEYRGDYKREAQEASPAPQADALAKPAPSSRADIRETPAAPAAMAPEGMGGVLQRQKAAIPMPLKSISGAKREGRQGREAVPERESAPAENAAMSAPAAEPLGLDMVHDNASVAPDTVQDAADTPEAWLKRIETLRAQKQRREAFVELQRFRARYPDYPLPAGMRALIETGDIRP